MKLLLRPYLTLVLLLSSIACHKENTPGVHVEHDQARLIPPQTLALAGIDCASLKTAPLYQRHANVLDLPLVAGAGANIGVDPRRNVKSVVVALVGDQTLAIANGTFSRATVQQKLSGNGARLSQYANQTVVSSGEGAVSFPSDGIAVAGPIGSVHRSLDAGQKKNGGIPDALQPRLQLLPANDQIWFVSNGPLPVQRFAGASGVGSTLSSLAGFVNASAVGLQVDAGLHLTANLSCVSEKGAQQVRDALRGMVGLARLTTKDGEMDLLKAYDAIQISQEQETVRVQADISPELAEKLLAHFGSLNSSIGSSAR